MAQTVPATAVLGPGQTGLALGYRVLNVDGTVYSAFTVVNVAETAVLGTYRVANGVAVPDAGGYIVFGTAVLDLAEATAESVVNGADTLLNRDMSQVSDTNARSPLNALRSLRNKTEIAAGVLTVSKENDIAVAWTAAVITDATAHPIIKVDP